MGKSTYIIGVESIIYTEHKMEANCIEDAEKIAAGHAEFIIRTEGDKIQIEERRVFTIAEYDRTEE